MTQASANLSTDINNVIKYWEICPDKFLEDFFGIKLLPYQKILLRASDEFLDICFLINYHMLPFDWETDKTKQRWKERFGEYKYQMLLDFHECDIAR